MIRSGDVQTLERLGKPQFLTTRHVSFFMGKLGSARIREASHSVILRAGGVTEYTLHQSTEGVKCLDEHGWRSDKRLGKSNSPRQTQTPRHHDARGRVSEPCGQLADIAC